MLHLSNHAITVSILDPAQDKEYFGSRYCTGGYIWQICTKQGTPLMSGPRYPASHPPVFDGQGAPEAFVSPLGNSEAPLGDLVTVPGVGTVVKSSLRTPFHVRDNPEVREFCKWHVDLVDDQVNMVTHQVAGELSCSIKRVVMLDECVVISRTEVTNQSAIPLPLTWFAHPFFPLTADLRCARLDPLWKVPENGGYRKLENGDLIMNSEYPWEKGLFQQLDIQKHPHAEVTVYHKQGGTLKLTTDYTLDALPVWANSATFSLEPYMVCSIPAGGDKIWEIRYDFTDVE